MSPRREDLGSWLEGTPGGEGPEGAPSGGLPGLPAEGSGARAGVGRRLAALCVDWFLSLLVSGAFFPDPTAVVPRALAGEPLATLAVFGVSTAILVSTLGHTIGHRLLGIQVVRVRDLRATAQRGRASAASGPVRPPGLVAGVVRTALLCLVIPPAIWDAQGRGMHDVAADTVVLRR